MEKTTVLKLLEERGDAFLSGQAISETLGVTRAAVWKQIKRLREKGYEIEAVTNLGYRLKGVPEVLEKEKILSALGEHPWKDRIMVYDSVDSTNNALKRAGDQGAPHGTVVISDEQTGGRGRLGRSFASPKGVGIYLSLLLRPSCAPTQVGHLTTMVAVAVLNAIETVTGVRPGIKWTNDLVLNRKKMAGILTEMSVEWESSTLQYIVTGIGINCNHLTKDFPEDVGAMATSLRLETGKTVDRGSLCAEMVKELEKVSRELISGKKAWLEQYQKDCITIGSDVRVVRGSDVRLGHATGIDENGGLIVRYDSGEIGVVYSGEVSVRGMYGYV